MKKKLFAIAAAALFALGGIGFTATQWGSGPSLAERNARALADDYYAWDCGPAGNGCIFLIWDGRVFINHDLEQGPLVVEMR